MADPKFDEIRADARWFAHRYDRHRDEVHFVWLSRDAHRANAFLTQPEIGQASPRRIVPRRQISTGDLPQAPLHVILHSGLAGSTLLTRALDRDGVSMAFSEPPILTDIVSYRLAGASAQQAAALFDDVLALLARPFAPGEAVIVKMGSIGNALGGDILARRATSKALSLYAPLPVYLASVVRKGLEGRIWGRKLFATLRSAGMTELGFSEDELFEHTDLQIAADAWLALHRVMGAVLTRFPERAATIDSETLITQPDRAIAAIADHFGLPLDAAVIAADPLFGRHSKNGKPFDSRQRGEELRIAAALHGEEIDLVLGWARKVADFQRIRWELPGNLRS